MYTYNLTPDVKSIILYANAHAHAGTIIVQPLAHVIHFLEEETKDVESRSGNAEESKECVP